MADTERPRLDILPAADRKQAARHEATIALLRNLLAEAEAGNLTGLVGVIELAGGEDNRYVSTGTDDRYAQAGRLEALKLQMLGFRPDPSVP